MNIADKDRLLKKLRRLTEVDSITSCWLYLGAKVKGHGYARYNGRMHYVHRLSLFLVGRLDLSNTEIQANHLCKNKHCWNPEHLYVGTQYENIQDAIPNMKKELCRRGHRIDGLRHSTLLDRYVRYCKQCKELSRKRNLLKKVG